MSAKYVLISRFPLKNNVTPSSITGLKSTSEKNIFSLKKMISMNFLNFVHLTI